VNTLVEKTSPEKTEKTIENRKTVVNTIGKTKKTIGNPKNGRKYDRKSEKTENNSHREPRARPIAENTIKHMVFQ